MTTAASRGIRTLVGQCREHVKALEQDIDVLSVRITEARVTLALILLACS